MIVTLMGPDDLGAWVLTDDDGNSYPFVSSHEDHLNAQFFGWKKPDSIEEKEAIMDALDWLMEHSGEEFVAPQHVTEYFNQISNCRNE